MKVSVLIIVILVSTCIVNASVLDPVIENVIHKKATKPPSDVPGIWKKKTIWKSRWIKEWRSAKVMKPVWRKIWSPVQISEWVPIPKPPPGWDSVSTPLLPVKITSSKDTMPMWDPVPYPESQQPPPPQYTIQADNFCGNRDCNKPTGFSHSLISEIIGQQRHKKASDYNKMPYSESITHLNKVPSDSASWRSTRQSLNNFQSLSGFGGLPEPAQFLVPPKYQGFHENNLKFRNVKNNQLQLPSFQMLNNRPSTNVQITHSSGFEVKQKPSNSPYQWNPLQNESNIKNEVKTNIQPINKSSFHEVKDNTKLQQPGNDNQNSNIQLTEKPVSKTHSLDKKPQGYVDSDFIQEAQLVGEYHYSEFDLQKKTKSDPDKTESMLQNKESTKHLEKTKETTSKPVQKQTKTKLQSVPAENKPRQIRKNGHYAQHVLENNPHFHEKFTLNSASKDSPIIEQEKIFTKEIIPTFNTIKEPTLSNTKFELNTSSKYTNGPYYVHSSISPLTNHRLEHQTDHKSMNETASAIMDSKSHNKSSTLNLSNHKFLSSESIHTNLVAINNSSLAVIPAPKLLSEVPNFKPIPNYANIFEVVFHKAEDPSTTTSKIITSTVINERRPNETENFYKTAIKNTTPVIVVSPSSFLSDEVSKTESTTKSAVFIVTPVNSGAYTSRDE